MVRSGSFTLTRLPFLNGGSTITLLPFTSRWLQRVVQRPLGRQGGRL
jgi:hypothetical protein